MPKVLVDLVQFKLELLGLKAIFLIWLDKIFGYENKEKEGLAGTALFPLVPYL